MLQLLLKYNIDKVEPHFQRFIDENMVALAQPEAQFSELCVMIVQCLETSIGACKERQAASAKKHMTARVINNFDPDVSFVRSLVNIARDKLAMIP